MQGTSTRILVTGATGFIGKAVCQKLVEQGYAVRALLRNPAQQAEFSHLPQLEFAVGELGDAQALRLACDGVKIVIHLAGIAHVNNGSEGQLQKVNVEGTGILLQAAAACKVKRFIFMSSSLAEASEKGQGDMTAYGQSKLEAEKLVQSSADIESVILRPVNVYGPGMKGNIATMISLIDRGRLPPLPALDTSLSLVGIGDLVQAVSLVLATPEAADQCYTVSDGKEYRITEIEKAIYQALGRKLSSWRTPHVVLYAAAAGAGLLGKLRAKLTRLSGHKHRAGGGISARTYRNLVTGNTVEMDAALEQLGYSPAGNLYDVLPQIVQSIRSDSK